TLAADEGVVSWVNFSPDGKKLIASSQGSGVVVLWDVATGKELRRLQPSKGIWPAIFVLEGKVIAVGHGDGVISFWRPESGKKLGEVTSRPSSWPMSLASHGNLLASGGVDSGERGAPPVQLWELAWDKRDDSRITATEKKTFLGHDPGAVYSVAFTRNAKYLVSGGQDGTIRVWDLAGERQPMVLIPHTDFVYCVAVSPDGSLLASLGRDSIKMWSL